LKNLLPQEEWLKKRPAKELIESIFINASTQWLKHPNCLIITGPNLKRHINSISPIMPRSLVVVEREEKYFKSILKQTKRFLYPPYNLKLIFGDVKNIPTKGIEYLDLDLMATVDTSIDLICQKFIEQASSKKKHKAFIFTFSGRKTSSEKIINAINKVLSHINVEISGFDGFNNGFGWGTRCLPPRGIRSLHCNEHSPNIIKRSFKLRNLKCFRYSDTHQPMVSVMIIYI